MNQAPNPISPGPHDGVADRTNQVDRGRPAGRGRGSKKIQLKLTSMIDVVFLLLVFFVVTATFTADEGSLLATMPGDTGSIEPPPPPVSVELASSDDGVTYSLTVDGARVDSASDLSALMATKLQTGQIASDDLVMIRPQGHVRWQHVLNVYNACVSAELEQVSFAY